MISRFTCLGATLVRHALVFVTIGFGLSSLPATAVASSPPTMTTLSFQTYAYMTLAIRNSTFVEVVGPLATNASTTLSRDLGSIQFNEVTLPGMKAYAFADVGQIKTLARIGGVMTSTGNPAARDFAANAYAGFFANVVFDTGTPGQAGTATFAIDLDGVMHNRPTLGVDYNLPSNATLQYAAVSGFEFWILRSRVGGPCPPSSTSCNAFLDNPGPSSVPVQQSFLYTVPFVSGVPLLLGVELESGAYARTFSNGYVYGLSDFSHTLNWGGLVSATAGGNDITSTLQSGGGFDFLSPLNAAVPEPASWVLMIGGFGMVGGTMRRGRRVAVVA